MRPYLTRNFIPGFIFLCLLGFVNTGWGQSAAVENNEEQEDRFSFGNISPVILSKDGIEATFTNSLSSYWVTSKFGQIILDRYRITRFESNLNLNYGFSDNKRWDLGVQLKYSRLRFDENSRNSPLKVFDAPDATSLGYSSVSYAGLRVRTMPFEKLPEFTLQGSVLFPVAKEQETRSFLGADRIQTDLTATYFKTLTTDFYFYLQARYLLQIANQDNDKTTHFPGISALIVKSFLEQRLFVFPGISYFGAYQQNYKGGRLQSQAQYVMVSLGAQVQPLDFLGIFINAQRPWYYKSGVSFYSDLVKNSYSDWALGLRLIF